jgi:nucleoside-triphosphatase
VSEPQRFLLEGRPGVGKTTVTDVLASLLRNAGVPLSGFVTREIRERGRRLGFAIESMDGRQGTLAHIELPGPPTVGKYGVDLAVLERIGIPALRAPGVGGVVIVDELGKMELASEPFRDAVSRLFDEPAALVATIQRSRHPFTDALKARPGIERLTVTRENRERLPEELARVLIRQALPRV